MTVRIWALSPGNGGILRRIWDRSDMTWLTHSKERTGSVGNAVSGIGGGKEKAEMELLQ